VSKQIIPEKEELSQEQEGQISSGITINRQKEPSCVLRDDAFTHVPERRADGQSLSAVS
jgi:hypothetical protein